MARNGSGTMAVVNTFVAGNTITAAGHNQNNTDIASEITNSIAVDGQSTMTGQFKASNGTAGAPAWTFGSDLDTGVYRVGANQLGMAAGGAEIVAVMTNDVQFLLTSSILLPVGTTGQRPTSQVAGRVRFNSTTSLFEFDTGSVWASGLILPRGYIDGCVMANGADATNDITITAGTCRDSTNAVNITVAAMATGKQLDANWAAGDAAGMRNSAAGIANTTYHIYAVAKADGTQDIYAHTSATVATVITALQAETGGSSYLYARRIGSIVRLSAAIQLFTQRGNYFEQKTPFRDFNQNTGTTNALTVTLTSVPAGVAMQADISVAYEPNGGLLYISALTQTDAAPSASATPLTLIHGVTGSGVGRVQVWTDTAQGVRLRTSDTGTTVVMVVNGWIDLRGKDS